MLRVEIDQDSGFCFGVVNAIENAEKELLQDEQLACLGDIVHNNQEVERLQKKGLKTINHEQLKSLKGKKVLLRAHGEPPSTYKTARDNNIRIIDATCPVVLQLQKKIKKQYEASGAENAQIVIFGKIGHAEVNGLVGQTAGNAIVIEKKEDIGHLDFNREIYLFSQTTMSLNDFRDIVETIKSRMKPDVTFKYFDTICRQVANRMPNIKMFAARHDLVLFVAGKKSSNGKVLYEECLQANPNTHLISTPNEIDPEWLKGISSVGICGATSTPKWLMEDVASRLSQYPLSSETSEG
ncbi:4-hydroxy-3-methylbut-2-enyl diphosphate reductase [Bacteroidia bacterium]|nr:4-hydroxy-3-methylbut-2-enyl diphosphate reductase [Bacteroidia bacterium]GHV20658.1 4-hydroxy-3-methylbut-2-enyl diphosphate reductase [Bacteroidia bacterium]